TLRRFRRSIQFLQKKHFLDNAVLRQLDHALASSVAIRDSTDDHRLSDRGRLMQPTVLSLANRETLTPLCEMLYLLAQLETTTVNTQEVLTQCLGSKACLMQISSTTFRF